MLQPYNPPLPRANCHVLARLIVHNASIGSRLLIEPTPLDVALVPYHAYFRYRRVGVQKDLLAKLVMYLLYLWPEQQAENFTFFSVVDRLRYHSRADQEQIVQIIGAYCVT